MTHAQKRKYHHLDEHKSKLFVLLSIMSLTSVLSLAVEVSYKGLHAGVRNWCHIPPAHPSPSCSRQRPLADDQGSECKDGTGMGAILPP